MAELARDYLDTAKQDLNEEIVDIFPASLRNYNLDILMPTVRGQVILEIPCGIGSLGRTYYKKEVRLKSLQVTSLLRKLKWHENATKKPKFRTVL